MSYEKLQSKIKELSASQGLSEDQIIDNLISQLETKYNSDFSEEDQNIIIELKGKIGRKLYEADRHKISINHSSNYKSLFDIDEIELKLFRDAVQELVDEDLVQAFQFEIGLTEKGIRKFR